MKISSYTKYHKRYKERHKKEVADYMREYRERNRERLNAYRRELRAKKKAAQK
jgi:hypothetical protein